MMTHEPHYRKSSQIKGRFKNNMRHSKMLSLQKASKVCLKVRVSTDPGLQWIPLTASRWMAREEASGSWGWEGRVLRSMSTDRLANQSIKPLGSSERLKFFVWVSPMAWPWWLSVSQRELYLLQLQALYCRTLFKSGCNPYTPLHEYCRSLLSQAITTGLADFDQCSLTVISLVDSLEMLFSRSIYFGCAQELKANI